MVGWFERVGVVLGVSGSFGFAQDRLFGYAIANSAIAPLRMTDLWGCGREAGSSLRSE